jgi:hypothetical protein
LKLLSLVLLLALAGCDAEPITLYAPEGMTAEQVVTMENQRGYQYGKNMDRHQKRETGQGDFPRRSPANPRP